MSDSWQSLASARLGKSTVPALPGAKSGQRIVEVRASSRCVHRRGACIVEVGKWSSSSLHFENLPSAHDCKISSRCTAQPEQLSKALLRASKENGILVLEDEGLDLVSDPLEVAGLEPDLRAEADPDAIGVHIEHDKRLVFGGEARLEACAEHGELDAALISIGGSDVDGDRHVDHARREALGLAGRLDLHDDRAGAELLRHDLACLLREVGVVRHDGSLATHPAAEFERSGDAEVVGHVDGAGPFPGGDKVGGCVGGQQRRALGWRQVGREVVVRSGDGVRQVLVALGHVQERHAAMRREPLQPRVEGVRIRASDEGERDVTWRCVTPQNERKRACRLERIFRWKTMMARVHSLRPASVHSQCRRGSPDVAEKAPPNSPIRPKREIRALFPHRESQIALGPHLPTILAARRLAPLRHSSKS
ncbi:hypothetical protein L1887_61751 [Cichorium endivia]|nr:hypothetical protein L1887_61751 [Cichorium endivia]